MTIRIEHSGDGTLVYGTERGDAATADLKDKGFRWSRNLSAWYLPRNQTFAHRDMKVTWLTEAFERNGIDYELERSVERTTTAEERVEQRIERAESRQERYEDRADRARAESDEQYGRADRIAKLRDGQPILIGHHSERRGWADQRRIETGMRKSIEADNKARHYDKRAKGTEAERKRLRDPVYLGNKINSLEAEARDVQRQLTGKDSPWSKPAEGDYRERLEVRGAEIEDELAFYRQTRDDLGVKQWGPDDIEKGDTVTIRGRRRTVVRVNKKTVAVETGYSWTDKVPYHEIQDVERSSVEAPSDDLARDIERPSFERQSFDRPSFEQQPRLDLDGGHGLGL